jgi:hypothetical protein
MLDKLDSESGNRRDFLKKTGKQALWMAPTLTVLMTASSQPAHATYKASCDTKETYQTYHPLQNLKPLITKILSFFHF